MLEAFRRDGGLIVEGMFNRATIDAVTAAADRRVPEFPPGSATQGMGAAGAAFVGANTVRFSSLPLLDDAYFDMLDNEIYAAIADAVLLPHCGSYWVNTGQIMYIGPGEAAPFLVSSLLLSFISGLPGAGAAIGVPQDRRRGSPPGARLQPVPPLTGFGARGLRSLRRS